MKLILLSLIVSSAIGCASATPRLQLATCTNVPCTPSQVKVQEVKRSILTVEWQAVTPQGVYACMADDMVRQTVCRIQ